VNEATAPSVLQEAAMGSEPGPDEATYASHARKLVSAGRAGALATLSRRAPGFPFASVAPYGLLPDGSPTFFLSAMAMHTQNIAEDPRASLLVMESGAADDPVALGRVTLLGAVTKVASDAVSAVRADYFERHPDAKRWESFTDFAFYRMDVASLYWVGGFGAMGWVEIDAYHRTG